MEKFFNYAFILMFLLIVVAYYKGVISIVDTGGGAINTIFKTLQGRDVDGNFANYPKG
jgi:hypothetical protein